MVNSFQTIQGLRSYAEYLQNRMKDLALANDKLREDLACAHNKYDELISKYEGIYVSPYVPNLHHKIRKLEKENKHLKNSIQKVYLKYVEPINRKHFDLTL